MEVVGPRAPLVEKWTWVLAAPGALMALGAMWRSGRSVAEAHAADEERKRRPR